MTIKSIAHSVAFLLFGSTITLGIFWYLHPEGNYEPLTLVLLTLATVILLIPEIPIIKNKIKPITPEQILEYREKMRKEIERNIEPIDKYKTHGRAIIRDINRMDHYPDIDNNKKGISPWFRLEIKGFYHRGVEFFMRVLSVKYEPNFKAWRIVKDDEEGREKAFLVCQIPFERIVRINWDGDEYYNEPHFYCNFSNKKKEPYEELLLYKEEGTGEHTYFSAISEYYAAEGLQKK